MIYLLRRFAFYVAAFFVALTFNFFIPRLMPGDPSARIIASFQGRLNEAQIDAIRQSYGLTGSLWEQYLTYMGSVFRLDFGISTVQFPEPTASLLFYGATWTLVLVGLAVFFAFIIGSMMGIHAAWNRGGFFDSFFTPINVMMNAFTPAIVALLLFYAFSLQLQWFPLGRAHSTEIMPGFTFLFIGNVLYHATLPVLSIFLVSFGGWHLGMRNVMINLLNEDFVILARAKGLSDRRVRYRYVARNAILPQITALALSIGFLLGGALVTEQVFNYPGLGKFTFTAIGSRDYSFIQGQLLLLTASVLVANMLSDIANVILDPRLRT
ncbi:peptide ABC transporter permease [Devosia epidermidihirudinis]|uniref:Peptide ABC transporter permease n=1 Tax=Devosia epidermidihirudinis TaxID=1293439 RepID=A0A0F5QDH5_9HYPH|nr:ABC transporter permease [Devosia epidermidihirudinis]KKC38776.1 peptide ABC transporter permease [Devosia epidermidihirudinis]